MLASKEMWVLSIRTSSSCFPTTFFFGQLASSSLWTGQEYPSVTRAWI